MTRSVCAFRLLVLVSMRVFLMFRVCVGARVAIQLEVVGFDFFLVALGRRSLGFSLERLIGVGPTGASKVLSLDGALAIENSRFAFGTRVRELVRFGLLYVVGVEALDVLPRVARLAIDREPVIVSEAADTLDGVRLLLLVRPDGAGFMVQQDRNGLGAEGSRLTRGHEMRRRRIMLFCHHLTGHLTA